jgi:hypothetical protein
MVCKNARMPRQKKTTANPDNANRAVPRNRATVGVLSPAEIKFARLVAEGGRSAIECAALAGLIERRRDGVALRNQRASTWLKRPLVRAEIVRYRRVLSEAARIDVATLAAEFREKQTVDRTAIYGEDGAILPMDQWPAVLRTMVKSVRHNPKTGKIAEVVFQDVTHLDRIMASWVGMIGERLPDTSAESKIEVIIEQVVGPREALPMPTGAELEAIEAELLAEELDQASTQNDQWTDDEADASERPVDFIPPPESTPQPVDWNEVKMDEFRNPLDDLKW